MATVSGFWLFAGDPPVFRCPSDGQRICNQRDKGATAKAEYDPSAQDQGTVTQIHDETPFRFLAMSPALLPG